MGDNEPTNTQTVLGVLISTVAAIIIAATGSAAAFAAVSAAGTATAALAPLTTSVLVYGATAAGRMCSPASRLEYLLRLYSRRLSYGSLRFPRCNTDPTPWISCSVRGRIFNGKPCSAREPMCVVS